MHSKLIFRESFQEIYNNKSFHVLKHVQTNEKLYKLNLIPKERAKKGDVISEPGEHVVN